MNIPCCLALTVKHQAIATQALQPPYAELVAALPAQPQLNGDESPAKEGQVKSWLWTFVAQTFIAFALCGHDHQRTDGREACGREGLRPGKNVLAMQLFSVVLGASESRLSVAGLTTIENCRQQQRNVFAFVTQPVEAYFHHEPSTSLFPKP